MITLDTHSAFDFYQSIAHRLPAFKDSEVNNSAPAKSPTHASDLLAIANNFDVFVFDAFGVLNVGTAVIPGAALCIDQLRARKKQVIVLTNGASSALSVLGNKYRKFGFDFTAEEIVSSRHAAEQAIGSPSPHWSSQTLWGAITGGVSTPADLQVKALELNDTREDYDRVDAFLFLSSGQWTDARQQMLFASLRDTPRPVVVANPDVVAPLVAGFSLEPGYFAHSILDQFDEGAPALPVQFHGKPFPSVYDAVRERIEGDIPAHRIAMLGDTLHTDVLGAKAQGWSSVLVADHGLFRGFDVTPFIQASGLVPDWIIPSI